jgi:hypothetical protein
MARVEIKVSIWEAYEIDSPEQLQEILAKLESGEIRTGEDISLAYDIPMNYIDDTSEDLSVEDNDGCSTIELRDDEGQVIWSNGLSDPT